ncbi:ABC transporter substrate-binding protein [Clostridium guangxiense]|uniref:hypothetical protein n=1 Tax=Clostridium guangxiense TaxID=1662055 RepID=UPI001E34C3EB|nr:hypothetical protein [Clostridium guangxiense]MCD2348283.1 hypothetical protein [Clostridium guangxiense]
MKKILIPSVLILIIITSACGKQEGKSVNIDDKVQTIAYQAENGPVKVPSKPKRIVVLNSAISGHVMALVGNIVGVSTILMMKLLLRLF